MDKHLKTEAISNTIKQMDDKRLLLVFKKKNNYNDEFLLLAKEEVIRRGYDYQTIPFEDVDVLVFHHKTTEELVEIVSDEKNHYNRLDVALAISELEKRNYNLSYIHKIEEKKRIANMQGDVGGSISTTNGIGTKLYGKMKQYYGTYIITLWFVIFFVPIIPLASYHVLNRTEEVDEDDKLVKYYEMAKIPINRKQVGITYIITFSIVLFFYFILKYLFASD